MYDFLYWSAIVGLTIAPASTVEVNLSLSESVSTALIYLLKPELNKWD